MTLNDLRNTDSPEITTIDTLIESKRGVKECVRCGDLHRHLLWRRFSKQLPSGIFDEQGRAITMPGFALCPKTREPIFFTFVEVTDDDECRRKQVAKDFQSTRFRRPSFLCSHSELTAIMLPVGLRMQCMTCKQIVRTE